MPRCLEVILLQALSIATKMAGGSVHLPARAPQSPITAPLICVDIDARPPHVQYYDMVNEVSTVSHLRHPNLVLFLGACTKGDEPLMILNESVAPSTCPLPQYSNAAMT